MMLSLCVYYFVPKMTNSQSSKAMKEKENNFWCISSVRTFELHLFFIPIASFRFLRCFHLIIHHTRYALHLTTERTVKYMVLHLEITRLWREYFSLREVFINRIGRRLFAVKAIDRFDQHLDSWNLW